MMDIEDVLFRDFLVRINFHRYLEYYILCHKIISEDVSIDAKAKIVKEIICYLQKSPLGHNLALRSQTNRYNLLCHCQNLKSINNLNIELFKESHNYVFMKLVNKYSLYKRIIKRVRYLFLFD